MLLAANVSVVHGKRQGCKRQMSEMFMVNVKVVSGKCQCCSWQMSRLLAANVSVVHGKCQCCSLKYKFSWQISILFRTITMCTVNVNVVHGNTNVVVNDNVCQCKLLWPW